MPTARSDRIRAPSRRPMSSKFPDKVDHVTISPEGRFFTMVREHEGEEVLAVYDLDRPAAPGVAMPLQGQVVSSVAWANENRLLVTLFTGFNIAANGNYLHWGPTFRTVSMDRDGSRQVLLFENARGSVRSNINLSQITDLLPDDPRHVLMPAYRRGDLDLWKVDVYTGEAERVEKCNPRTRGWITNIDGIPVFRFDINRRGTLIRYYVREADGGWDRVAEIREDDLPEFSPQAAAPTPGLVYVVARPDGAERSAVYLYDLTRKELTETVASHPRVDIESVVSISRTGEFVGAAYYVDRLRYELKDEVLQRHVDGVNAYFDNTANVLLKDASSDFGRVVMYASGPRDAGSYHIYDRVTGQLTQIASVNPDLPPAQLSPVEVIDYTAHDGAALRGYLTLPVSPLSDTDAAPLVVVPHGGPHRRDYYDYDLIAQFLASRGYAVFQTNFRGSDGFGLSFREAGYREWGGLMQSDVTDGLQHLIKTGRADADRVCTLGFSYGGYAALAGAAFTPSLYRCAASINGIGDLPVFLEQMREKHGRDSEEYKFELKSIGDPDDDAAALTAASPANHAGQITAPVLLIAGAKDNNVPPEQTRLMLEKMADARVPARKIMIEDAGHSFRRAADMARVLYEIESFLGRHLGGRTGAEPDYDAIEAHESPEDAAEEAPEGLTENAESAMDD